MCTIDPLECKANARMEMLSKIREKTLNINIEKISANDLFNWMTPYLEFGGFNWEKEGNKIRIFYGN
jgi:hypothetical protein